MGREIKFRAWDAECETMVYSDGRTIEEYQCFYGFIVGNSGSIVCIWSEDYDDSCGYASTRGGELDNLMQFTGLFDKQGKEIYEGDIVRLANSSGFHCLALVEFNDGCFDVKFKETLYDYNHNCSRKRDYLKIYVANHAIEVIGNIHHNADLLNID